MTLELSLVTTMFRSAQTIEEFCRRAIIAARTLTPSFEIVIVNDGSPDDSLQRALALLPNQPELVIVDLARNFGHHRAMMAGLARARGQRIFLIDSDLEEDPGWLLQFDEVQRSCGADVVFGVQDTRKGGVIERLLGTLFYRTVNLLFDFPIPENVVTARLMTRRYVRALVAHRERTFAIAGLWAMTGFEQTAVTVRKSARAATTYSLWRRVAALVNAVTAFTARPLVWIFYLGAFIMLLSSLVAGYLVVRRLNDPYLEGWVSVFVSIWFLGGLTIFCVGVIGIYLAKVFEETKRRPYVTVRAVHRGGSPAP